MIHPSAPLPDGGKTKRRRGLMLLAIGVSSLPTTAVVLAFPGGNLWVESSWRQFRAEWSEKGEMFELESWIAPEIPDTDNFARVPLIAELYRRDQALAAPGAEESMNQGMLAELETFSVFRGGEARSPRPAPALSYLSGIPADLALYLPAWEEEADASSAAARCLALFALREETLAALMEASRLPTARYPFDPARPRANRLSHMPALIPALHSLRLYLLALIQSESQEADSRLAADRIAGTLRLIRLGTSGPGLASYSVQLAALESAGLEPVWHALRVRRLDDAEWVAIDRELRAFEFGPRLLQVLRFERAALVRDQETLFASRSARPFSVPPAWVRLADLKEYAELTQRYWFTDPAGGGLLRDGPMLPRLAVVEDLTRDLAPTTENLLVATGVLPVHDFAVQARATEAHRDHALIAIALERHLLAQGRYPGALRELVPRWLEEIPADPDSGQPPLYQLLPDGADGADGANGQDGYRLRAFREDPQAGDPVWILPLSPGS